MCFPGLSVSRARSWTRARNGCLRCCTAGKAAERLATLHTPEGSALPPNVSAELRRDMARLGFVVSQIKEIEEARQERLEQEPETGPHAMVRHLARVVGVGIETADMLVNEVLSRPMRDRKAVARHLQRLDRRPQSRARRAGQLAVEPPSASRYAGRCPVAFCTGCERGSRHLKGRRRELVPTPSSGGISL